MVPWALTSQPGKRHLDRFSRFDVYTSAKSPDAFQWGGHLGRFTRFGRAYEQTDRHTDTQIDRQTVHATPCVAVGRYRKLTLRCGLTITKSFV